MSRLPNPGRRPQTGNNLPRLGLYPMELSRNIRVDSVSRLDPAPPLGIDADATVDDAISSMREHNVGCLLVTETGRVVGIFTERDLLTRVLARGRSLDEPLRSCMTPNPVTVGPKDPVRTAIRRMQKGGYRHLPVVDDSGRPIGMLSSRRVVHYLVEHFPALIFNQPPNASQFPETAEGA
ncbi:MAG TPA: CBS domain-containing protein [Gemmata sp.]|jgi:signal-transduction protein with cAMP-binding, CBS, and nucleotidyltransferase domain|nr:CBS domain-containing protein [Gemmata sp.]